MWHCHPALHLNISYQKFYNWNIFYEDALIAVLVTSMLFVYVIGLHAVQFGNNWMRKIQRTANLAVRGIF